MAKKIVSTNLTVILLVLTAFMVHSYFVKAGNLEPTAPPDPTMKTLDEIYDAVTAPPDPTMKTLDEIYDAVTAPPPQREPYFKEFNPSYYYSGKKEILTVPEGKKLVILKMYVTHYDWEIATCTGTCNFSYQYETILQGETFNGFSDTMQYVHEFPDGSISFEGGQTLWLVNHLSEINLKALLFGYICDAQ